MNRILWTNPNSAYCELIKEELGFSNMQYNECCVLDKISAITDHCHNLFTHNSYNTLTCSDILGIIRAGKAGSAVTCVEFARVTVAALCIYGFKARVMYLARIDVEDVDEFAGHVVLEVWLEDYSKWLFVDPQFNCLTLKDGRPLNTLELCGNIEQEQSSIKFVSYGDFDREEYLSFIEPYLYYVSFAIDQKFDDSLSLSSTRIMYTPSNAKQPKFFQKQPILISIEYTNSANEFYGWK